AASSSASRGEAASEESDNNNSNNNNNSSNNTNMSIAESDPDQLAGHAVVAPCYRVHDLGACTPCSFFGQRRWGCRHGDSCKFCHSCVLTKQEVYILKRSKRGLRKGEQFLPSMSIQGSHIA
ncbi:unnamed protein product, partial [Polarella glacialis]